jgi:UDP-N-acetylmuramate: L-alanyl-gamma-D-glutamyl-meso-diaminopimelate ligase
MVIYFLGICGTAMGHVAFLIRELGHTVLGSDEDIYPPMSDLLEALGVTLLTGYDPDRLAQLNPDLVVVGNASSRGNPEIEWLLENRSISFVSMPELIYREILAKRQSVVITGTHGKTTTTAATAYLLKNHLAEKKLHPGYLIGGMPKDWESGASLGDAEAPFVIEGDEYDSAFFDKRSKFIHYYPKTLVIGNLEFDHGDIFRDLEDVFRAFRHLLKVVPASGNILINADDPNVCALLPIHFGRLWRLGVGESCDLRIANFKQQKDHSEFELQLHGQLWGRISTQLPGLFNARNLAMAALASAVSLYPNDPMNLDLSPLSTFSGVKRRQQIHLETPKRVVIEDFGHHPTAIAQTIEALRLQYPAYRMVACFEPRSNTTRTSVFQKEFSVAFSRANAAYFGPVHRAEKLNSKNRLNLDDLCAQLSSKGCVARHFTSNLLLLESLRVDLEKSSDSILVCFFSNGSFDGICGQLGVFLSHNS